MVLLKEFRESCLQEGLGRFCAMRHLMQRTGYCSSCCWQRELSLLLLLLLMLLVPDSILAPITGASTSSQLLCTATYTVASITGNSSLRSHLLPAQW
jgi:hypothetical protein